jgi:rsbT co-antagonist protein RsbR
MSPTAKSPLVSLLQEQEQEILKTWLAEQQKATGPRSSLISGRELESQSREFLALVRQAVPGGLDPNAQAWQPVRDYLGGISRMRATQGFTPIETAKFVFSFKYAVFAALRQSGASAETQAEETWRGTLLIDELGLFTMEQFQRTREEVIRRQQQEILELSTPVVKLWDGVVAVPLIGTLDSARTQVVMESLLERIVETGASIAIIDITGVPTVDTLVAQHLIKTVAAARLMGADCIISGIRPQIAQTIVHLGINLEEISTKASLADAIALAFVRLGITIRRG